MRAGDLVASAVVSLRRTKTRSLLTMLGIVVGIASVILVLSIGEAAQTFIVGQVASFGSDVILVGNGPNETKRQNGTPNPFVKETLTVSDYKKLKGQPWITLISPALLQSDTASANGQELAVQVEGTAPDEVSVYDAHAARGTFLSVDQVDAHARVAVLGATVAKKLFGQEEAVGRLVKIGRESFRVIGVMESIGTRFFQNMDEEVYVPYTAAMDLYNKKYFLMFSIRASVYADEASRRVEDLLRDQHHITRPEDDDFHTMRQDEIAKTAEQITGILQILLASIAAISLIVGGLGIMNIMYVSVTERTREIGLRKALGARRRDILRQFLVEATILTGVAGLIGVGVGVGLTWLAIQIIGYFQAGWSFALSWRGLVYGVTVSAAIGCLFGYAPARRAASLHPIQALRKE